MEEERRRCWHEEGVEVEQKQVQERLVQEKHDPFLPSRPVVREWP